MNLQRHPEYIRCNFHKCDARTEIICMCYRNGTSITNDSERNEDDVKVFIPFEYEAYSPHVRENDITRIT